MELQRDNTYDLLSKLFVYKAEWLEQDMFNLYTKPSYFPEITGVESCVLIGGRGTGKTTVLKGLSYLGQFAQNEDSVITLGYYGLYYKVESNRVSAFTGLNKNDKDWERPFAHYVNLIVLSLAADMLIWMEERNYVDSRSLHSYKWRILENSMKWDNIKMFTDFKSYVHKEISAFESYINNNITGEYNLTILGGPIDYLFEALAEIDLFKGKKIFLLIDEYENLSTYQQEVVNTLVKQSSGKNYSFKIGVRELGWKSRVTLNKQELRSPSDYRKIEIQHEIEGSFDDFATSVCEGRLNMLYSRLGIETKASVKNIFPGITIEEEADLLGIEDLVNASKKCVDIAKALPNIHLLYVWFLYKWKKNENLSVKEIITDYKKNKRSWDTRYENYKYSILFAIRDRKVGIRQNIRKLYSGWGTLVLMAGANIRLMLQLIETCLKLHIKESGTIGQPVSVLNQTKGAQKVGGSNFDELEGLDVNGDLIMRLLQGLGRVFELLAREPFGHAPEINQFWISDLGLDSENFLESKEDNVQSLIEASLSHLALRRSTSTKLARNAPKSFDYSIHPIFSALFQISHRKKRKLNLSRMDIKDLITNQRIAIETLLKSHNREDESSFEDEHVIEEKISKKSDNRPGSQLELF